MIDIISKGGGMAGIPDSVSSPELAVDMTGKDHHGFIAMAQEYPQRFTQAQNIVTLDGLRVEYADGFWFGARIPTPRRLWYCALKPKMPPACHAFKRNFAPPYWLLIKH